MPPALETYTTAAGRTVVIPRDDDGNIDLTALDLDGDELQAFLIEIGRLTPTADKPLSGYAKAKANQTDNAPTQATPAEPLIDQAQVLRFLQLLGRDNDERVVVALFPADPGKPMIHKPQDGASTTWSEASWKDFSTTLKRRAGDQLSLGMVINRCGKQPADWGTKPEHFSGQRPSDREKKCAVWTGATEGEKWRNRPRTWGASNAHICEAVAVWFECDGGLSVAEQETLHTLIGLPPPSFTVWTGGKSLHCYYVLDGAITPEQFHFLMDWIVRALKAVRPDAGADPSLKNPSRVMRCPGGIHATKGGRAYIHSEHPEARRYRAEELEQALPQEHKPTASRVPSGASDDGGSKTDKAKSKTKAKAKAGKSGRHKWFHRLDPEQQWAEALLMLKAHPCRQKPSAQGGPAGTREPALKVLGALAGHFGDEGALKLCEEAQWSNEWWNPADELGRFDHQFLEISHAIDLAKEHGYLNPAERWQAAARAKANRGDGIKPSLTGEWHRDFDWMLTEERTVDVIIEEALTAQAAENGSKWWYYQGSFRRYSPSLGYYERVSHDTLTREITVLLRRVYELVGPDQIVVRKQTTAAKAVACTNWMASTVALMEGQMDQGRRIAFTNGTAYHDGQQWLLGQHSPDNLLSFGINGAWVDDAQVPPLFHEFVRTSYGLAWLNIIRAVLSYTADPVHICRIILFLIGPSGTGKGTLERLIEQVFPAETVAVLQNTADLNSPDKVAQLVAGRRLITFPDLQGHQSGLGTLYSLTESGLLTGRRLYSSDTFEVRFTGRVVVCSTQAPTFDNAGTGIARRLLTVPTLHQRLSSDLLPSNSQAFNEALAAEIGQLISWALQMPADEVEQVLQGNDPEGLLKAATTELESGLDGTRQFIDACLVPADGKTVPNEDDLFMAYRLFSKRVGLKGVCNQSHFISRLKGALPHLHRPRRMVKGVRVKAGFFGFSLVPDLWHPTDQLALQALRDNYRNRDDSSRAEFSVDGWDSTDLERAPRGFSWGVLVACNMTDGQLPLLKAHQPDTTD